MLNPVKERVVVITFEEISREQQICVRESFVNLLQSNAGYGTFTENILKIPVVKRPRMTSDGSEPDWASLKLGVRQVFRFRDASHRWLVQIATSFISINAVASEDGISGSASVQEVLSFYKWFTIFLDAVDSLKIIRGASLKSEVVYVFDNSALDMYVIEKDTPGVRDYLDIQNILHPSVDPKTVEYSLVAPLKLAMNYSTKCTDGQVGVLVSADIDHSDMEEVNGGWRFVFDMTATFRGVRPSAANSWGSVQHISEMVAAMDTIMKQLFTTKAYAELVGGFS